MAGTITAKTLYVTGEIIEVDEFVIFEHRFDVFDELDRPGKDSGAIHFTF